MLFSDYLQNMHNFTTIFFLGNQYFINCQYCLHWWLIGLKINLIEILYLSGKLAISKMLDKSALSSWMG